MMRPYSSMAALAAATSVSRWRMASPNKACRSPKSLVWASTLPAASASAWRSGPSGASRDGNAALSSLQVASSGGNFAAKSATCWVVAVTRVRAAWCATSFSAFAAIASAISASSLARRSFSARTPTLNSAARRKATCSSQPAICDCECLVKVSAAAASVFSLLKVFICPCTTP